MQLRSSLGLCALAAASFAIQASAAVTPYDADSGVLLYHFDEVVSDRVVNQGTAGAAMNLLAGGDASLTSPSVAGLGLAADFADGSGDLYRTAGSSSLGSLALLSSQAFTIEAWFTNPTLNHNGSLRDRTIFSVNNAAHRLTFIIQERTGLGDGAGMDNPYLARLIYKATDGTTKLLSSPTVNLDPSAWYHIAITFDNHGDTAVDDSSVKIYLTAESDTSGVANQIASWTNQMDLAPIVNLSGTSINDVLYIGNDATGTRGLGGKMDEFRYSNLALGAEDFNLSVIPEPTAMAVLGLGLAALMRRHRSH